MKISTDSLLIQNLLSRGIAEVYPSKNAFEEALSSGKKLTVYYGIDPTGPTLHMGHMIQIRKLRAFQQLGHRVILLIGDFTAQIGDPTDKAATRKPLTHTEVLRNSRLYRKQAARFLDFHGVENPAELLYNTHWLAKLSFEDVVELAGHFTVQRLLERDMFQRRIKEEKPIHLHEFLYPLMQGYDAVSMNVDVELCGNDQVFNALVGRDLVKQYRNKEKYVLVTKLLTDPTGKKMGKSEGNMIAMTDAPEEMYGKIMAIPDELIFPHFELTTDVSSQDIEAMKKAIKAGENPRDIKMRLAYEVVKTYASKAAAERAQAAFVLVFQKKDVPLHVPTMHIKRGDVTKDGRISCFHVLLASGLVQSKNEVRRLVAQRGLRINQSLITDAEHDFSSESDLLVQKGKRHFLRIFLE